MGCPEQLGKGTRNGRAWVSPPGPKENKRLGGEFSIPKPSQQQQHCEWQQPGDGHRDGISTLIGAEPSMFLNLDWHIYAQQTAVQGHPSVSSFLAASCLWHHHNRGAERPGPRQELECKRARRALPPPLWPRWRRICIPAADYHPRQMWPMFAACATLCCHLVMPSFCEK